MTNGPFRLRAWEPGRAMILERYPAYHGRFEGNLQRVELSLRADLTAGLGAYEADALDALDITFFSPAELDRARQRHAGEYVSAPRPSTLYIAFDLTRPPFDDTRVRRAFALATHREELVNVVLKGSHSAATGGFVPPGMPGHSAGIGLPYDAEGARRLLAEAGYPGGEGFPQVQAELYRGLESQGDYLRTQWREVLGVDITWEALEFADFLDRLRGRQPDIWIVGWWAKYPDPDHFLRAGPDPKRTGWRNQVFDRLVEEARMVTDQEERLKLYAEAERILVEEAAIIPLIHWRWHRLVKPWVKRFPSSGIYLPAWKHVIIEPH
ncbi:ABC transporter substrate-binding protein [Chloroflexota bacterium]